MASTTTHALDPKMAECIDECHSCATTCNSTLAYCLEQGGKHAESTHITLLIDCAAICEAAAGSMSRSSSVHGHFCRACAEVCRACEQSCRGMGNDATMKDCADACRRCAESCDRMAA